MRKGIGYYIRRIQVMSPIEFIRILKAHIHNDIGTRLLHMHDEWFPTHKYEPISKRGLLPIGIDAEKLDFSGFDIITSKELWRMYRSHRLDLLGSGWVNVGYHKEAFGFHGYMYEYNLDAVDNDFLRRELKKQDLKYARKVWSMIKGPYSPIDWQRDVKSGYRWGTSIWYMPVKLADKPGGDIKMPWEMSRLQHLPRLAIFYRVLPEYKDEIATEYENEILDFIAQNPIRRGVCFMCPMDIGIRLANIVLSYSLFCSLGHVFSDEFQQVLCNHIIESCSHIRKNLELSSLYNSNHYFSDIAGILFGAAILPKCKKREVWLKFARDEIDREIMKQFNPEGTNREGSVAYHRLTSELALYSVSLIRYLSVMGEIDDISDKSYSIVGRACQFMNDVKRPDGLFPSLGDNDGGVFFRLSFTGEMITPDEAIRRYVNLENYKPTESDRWYYDENLCDGDILVAGGLGLYANLKTDATSPYPFETSLISVIIQGQKQDIEFENSECFRCNIDTITSDGSKEVKEKPVLNYRKTRIIETKSDMSDDSFTISVYSEFGVVIYKRRGIYLCVNLSDNGQNGNAGHAHNDKLSFELTDSGKVIYEDPGTYVYTADVDIRDRFRSVHCHNTIQTGEEQNRFNGTFSMKDETSCRIIKADVKEFIGEVKYRDVLHRRTLRFSEHGIEVMDECNRPFEYGNAESLHTRGYGKLLREQ